MNTTRTPIAAASLVRLSNTETTRTEVRQFLGALLGLAFVLSTFGVRDGGAMAFSADIVLALCGGWCANQLIRGKAVIKEQVVSVLQAYFIGLLGCSVALFAVGWLVFLPSELFNFGKDLLLAATFTTNIGMVLFPVDSPLRFDGVLDHLWVPALIAQCVLIVSGLFFALRRNTARLLLVLILCAIASLSVSRFDSAVVQLLPIGGLWPFLLGAIPFLASNRYRIFKHALFLGIFVLIAGVAIVTVSGSTLPARAFLVLGISLMYLGSRPITSDSVQTMHRRRLFGLALHFFLWIVPLAHVAGALDLSASARLDFGPLIVPALFCTIVTWALWHSTERKVEFGSFTPTLAVVLVLIAISTFGVLSNGAPARFQDGAQAYLQVLEPDGTGAARCDLETSGPLAGLSVCPIGPAGRPSVLIWGDHQLDAMATGYAEAARRAKIPAIMVSSPNCIPLAGLQTRNVAQHHGIEPRCEQQSAQIMQALPHLDSIQHVVVVADWLYYTGVNAAEFHSKGPIRIGPNDGSPIDTDMQFAYIEAALTRTVSDLAREGKRVSILRQVPAQPMFDAEIAARSNTPAGWLYTSDKPVSTTVSLDQVTALHAPTDAMFRRLATSGQISYVNTWSTFCSSTQCMARGGLSSDYVSSTLLSASGALSLSGTLEEDLKRSRTHAVFRTAADS